MLHLPHFPKGNGGGKKGERREGALQDKHCCFLRKLDIRSLCLGFLLWTFC